MDVTWMDGRVSGSGRDRGDGLVNAGQMDTWVDVCICDSEVPCGWVMDR